MEENENKKNMKIFYLSLAVILTVVVIAIIATLIARRSDMEGNGDLSTGSGLTDDTQAGLGDDKLSDALPTFILPVSGELGEDFSDTLHVFSPTMNDYRTHLGVDIYASLGTEVKAVADGVVLDVWKDHFMGTCVSIEHSGNSVSIYKNLDESVADGIIKGASVKAGDVIGAVGETAMNEIACEPHLHYELKVDGKHVDPKLHHNFKKPEIEAPENSENQESNS